MDFDHCLHHCHQILKEFLTGVGAIIMGRCSYDIEVEEKWFCQFNYRVPIFIVSHDKPPSIDKDAEFIFVTEGIEIAHRQAKSKARHKNIWIFGGANIAQQYLKLGSIDEISIGITPTLLGNGKRLFDNLGKYIELTLIKTKRFLLYINRNIYYNFLISKLCPIYDF
jgi:dihydrofolate reductase